MHARFAEGTGTYRVYPSPSVGTPTDPPDVAARDYPYSRTTVSASENGATEVRQWRVLTGPVRGELTPRATVPRNGFETEVTVPRATYVAVQRLDEQGRVLGTSPAVEPSA